MPLRIFYGTLTVRSGADGKLGDATFVEVTLTARAYRLFSLDGFPVLVEDATNGAAIGVQVWEVPESQWEEIVASEPGEMYATAVELEGGRRVTTLVGPRAWLESQGAVDVTEHGSWSDYLAARAPGS